MVFKQRERRFISTHHKTWPGLACHKEKNLSTELKLSYTTRPMRLITENNYLRSVLMQENCSFVIWSKCKCSLEPF